MTAFPHVSLSAPIACGLKDRFKVLHLVFKVEEQLAGLETEGSRSFGVKGRGCAGDGKEMPQCKTTSSCSRSALKTLKVLVYFIFSVSYTPTP